MRCKDLKCALDLISVRVLSFLVQQINYSGFSFFIDNDIISNDILGGDVSLLLCFWIYSAGSPYTNFFHYTEK